MKRDLALLLLVLCVSLCALSGCSKEAVLFGYNRGLAWAGDLPLCAGSRLAGARDFALDHYTGGYHADYVGETGTEFLFGGTRLEPYEGLTLRCEMEAGRGEARLLLQTPEGETALCEAGQSCDLVLDLASGSNYIYIELADYTGEVSLTLEAPKDDA